MKRILTGMVAGLMGLAFSTTTFAQGTRPPESPLPPIQKPALESDLLKDRPVERAEKKKKRSERMKKKAEEGEKAKTQAEEKK